MNRRRWLIVLLFSIVFLGIFSTVSAEDEDITDDDFHFLDLFPEIEGFEHEPITYYMWQPDGFMGAFDPSYYLALLLFLITIFFLRFGIMILDFGLHPDFLNSFVEVIMDLAQSNLPQLVNFFLPIIIAIAGWFLIKDFRSGSYSQMGKRFITFLVGATAIGVFLTVGVSTVLKITDGVDKFSSITAGFLVASDEQRELNSEALFYNQVWEQIVYSTYAMGEVGSTDFRLTKDEAKDVNDALIQARKNRIAAWFFSDKITSAVHDSLIRLLNNDITKYSEGDRWADVMLDYPPTSKMRGAVISLFESEHEERYLAASDSLNRLILALVAFLASLTIFIFFLFFGVILLIFFFFFVGTLAAGMITLPLSLIAKEFPTVLLNWLKTLLAPLISKIVTSMYIALVFVIAGALLEASGNSMFGYIGALFFTAILFLLAIIAFFILGSKLSHSIFSPIYRTVSPVNRKVGQRFNKMRNRNKNNRAKDGADKNSKNNKGASDENRVDHDVVSPSRDQRDRNERGVVPTGEDTREDPGSRQQESYDLVNDNTDNENINYIDTSDVDRLPPSDAQQPVHSQQRRSHDVIILDGGRSSNQRPTREPMIIDVDTATTSNEDGSNKGNDSINNRLQLPTKENTREQMGAAPAGDVDNHDRAWIDRGEEHTSAREYTAAAQELVEDPNSRHNPDIIETDPSSTSEQPSSQEMAPEQAKIPAEDTNSRHNDDKATTVNSKEQAVSLKEDITDTTEDETLKNNADITEVGHSNKDEQSSQEITSSQEDVLADSKTGVDNSEHNESRIVTDSTSSKEQPLSHGSEEHTTADPGMTRNNEVANVNSSSDLEEGTSKETDTLPVKQGAQEQKPVAEHETSPATIEQKDVINASEVSDNKENDRGSHESVVVSRSDTEEVRDRHETLRNDQGHQQDQQSAPASEKRSEPDRKKNRIKRTRVVEQTEQSDDSDRRRTNHDII